MESPQRDSVSDRGTLQTGCVLSLPLGGLQDCGRGPPVWNSIIHWG
jgi:hypothetical protein